jgi:sulfur relay (sulfurtransferase) complex TusBCD TusD component (DsrE family)
MSEKKGNDGKSRKGTLTILLRSGPMMSTEAYLAAVIGGAVLDAGYGVNIFGYGEGALISRKGQHPKRFPDLENMFGELVSKGAKIAVCSTCSKARGVFEDDAVDGFKVGSLTTDLFDFLSESDRVITLGR